jgi:hypothetical protein
VLPRAAAATATIVRADLKVGPYADDGYVDDGPVGADLQVGPRCAEMRTARLDAVRRPFEDLFDGADVAAVSRRTNAYADTFAREGEGNGDHLPRVPGNTVAGRVQVIDDDVAAT